MLQRSPTYVVARPDRDTIANRLRKVLPDSARLQDHASQEHRPRPVLLRPHANPARQDTRAAARRRPQALGDEVDRSAFHAVVQPVGSAPVPDPQRRPVRGDHVGPGLGRHRSHRDVQFERDRAAFRSRARSRHHRHRDRFAAGDARARWTFEVDGEPVDFSQTLTYKGVAYSDVPNLVSTFGYINASWTLRSDLIARYVCRLLNHMAATGTDQCTPRLRHSDAGMPRRPWIEGFSSGYMQRMMPMLPKQGDRQPWLNPQRYDADRKQLAQGQPRRRGDAVHPNSLDGAVPLTRSVRPRPAPRLPELPIWTLTRNRPSGRSRTGD